MVLLLPKNPPRNGGNLAAVARDGRKGAQCPGLAAASSKRNAKTSDLIIARLFGLSNCNRSKKVAVVLD